MMDKPDNRAGVAEWTESLSDKAFVELFYELARRRGGSFSIVDSHRLDDGSWQHLYIAPHDPREYPDGWSDEAAICQFGTCDACGVELISWAKRALCPVCSETVYCG